MTFSHTPDRTPRRVRHPLQFRVVEVQRVRHVTPHLVRVTFGGSDLDGFASLGFDDHVKLVFPDPATGVLALPTLGPDGLVFPGPRPLMRDYTPLRYNAAARALDIDFAVHDAGPATNWAVQAAPGQRIGIGGPKGSFILSTDFDGHLLIGDDTALPAIARRLRELPDSTRAFVIAEVEGEADQVAMESDAEARIVWVHRNGAPAGDSALLLAAVRALQLPPGDLHAWVAAESAVARALHGHLVQERGWNPKWVKAAGYWRRGSAGAHDKVGD
ncbi:MAG: siderophore-interacting protein [Pseudomonadota bacterium]